MPSRRLLAGGPQSPSHLFLSTCFTGDLSSTPRDSDIAQNSFLNKNQLFPIQTTGGKFGAAYRNITQRLPFSNNFHTLSDPNEARPCAEAREKANVKLKCGNSILWFGTICPISCFKMNVAIVLGQCFPKDVT